MPEARGERAYTYQVNPECTCYNCYVTLPCMGDIKTHDNLVPMSHYISNSTISSVLTQIRGCIREFKKITLPGYIQM